MSEASLVQGQDPEWDDYLSSLEKGPVLLSLPHIHDPVLIAALDSLRAIRFSQGPIRCPNGRKCLDASVFLPLDARAQVIAQEYHEKKLASIFYCGSILSPPESRMRTVLFVCTGNVCRSPMAQGLFADLARGRRDIEVTSAGIGAVGGQLPSPALRRSHAASSDSISATSAASRSWPTLSARSDFIFVMTYGHLDSMLLLFPSAAEKTFLLREFETDLPVMERELPDPIGQSREVYRECRDQIRSALPRLLDLVLRSTHDETRVTAMKKVALAADASGGNEGAGPLVARPQWLSLRGPVGGCNSEEIATRVARAVSLGQADSGIVIDRTGFALSMAANKISGVRAVLAHNVEMARLSREQHDANVLCHRRAGNSGQAPQGNPRSLDEYRVCR